MSGRRESSIEAAAPDVLSAPLEAVLSDVRVQHDCRSATVRGRTVTADSPRALTGQLATALYSVVHVGRPATEPATEQDTTEARDLQPGLARGVPHERTRYRAAVLSDREDGSMVVGLSGVRVRVPPERLTVLPRLGAHASRTQRRKEEGDEAEVSVAAARPLLSPGFFLVDGSLPLNRREAILRVYVHVETPGAALEAWRRTLRCLEGLRVPYRAKAASSARALPRRDGVVVYLGSEDQHVLPNLVKALEGVALGADASPFTRTLAPGIAVAWEPDDPRPGMRNTSLGEHRARALAAGVVQYVTDRSADPGSREPTRSAVVRQALLDANIDPLDPARNLSSPAFFPAISDGTPGV